jgi:cyanophycinase
MRHPLGLALVAFVFVVARPARTEERLVLLGGGDHPQEAMLRFVEWAGGKAARVLVIPWASSDPKGSAKEVVQEVVGLGAGAAEPAPRAPLKPKTRAALLGQIEAATGVFFTGGDQGRIMDVLEDEPLLLALRARFRAGVVFGGTSAGTAIMSERMITGNGDFTVIDGGKVETRPGLGLLPKSVIVDQHFVKRQRQNRLFGLVLLHPEERGLGIDEGAALVVRDGREGEVMGRGGVMVVDARGEPDSLVVTLVRPGRRFEVVSSGPAR